MFPYYPAIFIFTPVRSVTLYGGMYLPPYFFCHSTLFFFKKYCVVRHVRNTIFFGRPFVKRFALCYRSVVCLSDLSVLSVTFVHFGQTVGRIKIKLGMQVGRGPGHSVLAGDPAPLPKGAEPSNIRHMSVVAKWLDGSRCHLVWR